MLNNDLVLLLYGLIDLPTFLLARLVCQKWYHLSFERNVLRRFYNHKHLPLAFGPSSWHSPQTLTGLLLRNDELDSNLASTQDEPAAIRSHNVIHIPYFSFCWTLGRFAFVVDYEEDSVRLHDVLAAQTRTQAEADSGAGDLEASDSDDDDSDLNTLWMHLFDADTILKVYHHRPILALDSRDVEDEVGGSIISLVLCDDYILYLFELHVRRTDKSVRVTQTRYSEHRWIEDIHMKDYHPNGAIIQGDWILFREHFPFLLHTPTL